MEASVPASSPVVQFSFSLETRVVSAPPGITASKTSAAPAASDGSVCLAHARHSNIPMTTPSLRTVGEVFVRERERVGPARNQFDIAHRTAAPLLVLEFHVVAPRRDPGDGQTLIGIDRA